MALLLAPYNDSMRLGMGFNSYTQTMCIDGAVEVTSKNQTKTENPSQVVTYSSKFVERLSDIVSSMNISYSSAIKKGTIEVSGNGNSIDEDKIKASDINLVVSVQVINQTTVLESSAKFKPMKDVNPSSQAFNDAFGDCYISGFIEGGDFGSIISMRCLDRSKKDSVVRSIKQSTKSSDPEDFSMDAYSFSNSLAKDNKSKDTETTISVNWMGGGQFKDSTTTWDVDSVYAAAAAFPAAVAKTPQKTWAILTKYKANRSFNDWAISLSLRPLEYDAVISYTAELFNNFMEYKQLIKKVQDIIQNRDAYKMSAKNLAIPTTISTLVAVRTALRNEMNKIVAVVNILSRNPSLLQSASSFNVVSKDELVRQIMEKAISAGPESKVIFDTTENTSDERAETEAEPAQSTASSQTQSSEGGDFDKIEHAEAKTPAIEEASKPLVAEKSKATPLNSGAEPKPKREDHKEGVKIDLSQLIAPEVWADLMPIREKTGVIEDSNQAATAAAATMFPPPPNNDAMAFLSVDNKRVIVHAAVCGIHDVTATIRGLVKEGSSIEIKLAEIDGLVRDPVYDSLRKPFVKNLSILYQYGDGPLRVASANHDVTTARSFTITNKSEDPKVTPLKWNPESWSVVGIVYGGKVYNTDTQIKAVDDAIRRDHNGSKEGSRCVWFTNQLFGEDPLPTYTKTGVVFYRREDDDKKPIYAAVGIDPKDPAALTAQPQLAAYEKIVLQEKQVIKEVPKEVVKEVVKQVPVQVIKEVIKEVPKEVIREVIKEVPNNDAIRLNGVESTRLSVTFNADCLRVDASDEAFVTFPNGTRHLWQPDGNYVVYDNDNKPRWAHNRPRSVSGDVLWFQQDGNFVAYGEHNTVIWTANTHEHGGQRLVLSSEDPYVEVFNGSGERVFCSSDANSGFHG